jgi:uncharacterized protein YdgA (DUF945 family)
MKHRIKKSEIANLKAEIEELKQIKKDITASDVSNTAWQELFEKVQKRQENGMQITVLADGTLQEVQMQDKEEGIAEDIPF